MTEPLPLGAYEELVTADLARRISATYATPQYSGVDDGELPQFLSRHVQKALLHRLSGMPAEDQLRFTADILEPIDRSAHVATAQLLHALVEHGNKFPRRPSHRFSAGALLTNARDEPSLGSELALEMETADRVDLLCAFVKFSGVRVIESELRNLHLRGVGLRVLTTTYMGATDRRALDVLVRDLGAEVRIKYEVSSTRLHAKAWLFHRTSGLHTAYVGSSNLSKPALVDGLEWNIRLSESSNAPEISKFSKVFESYWSSEEFEPYNPDTDAQRLDEALSSAGTFSRKEHGSGTRDANTYTGDQTPGSTHLPESPQRRQAPEEATDNTGAGSVLVPDLATPSSQQPIQQQLRFTPYPHQRRMLEALDAERLLFDRHKNLIVAATGTGKTVVAAFDYYRMCERRSGQRPSLLFVAHRKEILTQALATYRSILGDPFFGELLVGEHREATGQHVFASIQSLSRSESRYLGREWDVLVIDEFHHAEARTYQRLLASAAAGELLGLTATPERADGVNVATFFGGRIAAELRLWDALDQDLLCPFHYYGISDETDLTTVEWTQTGYDAQQLSNLYSGNDARARLILRALREKVLDPQDIRALGFCVSIEHANFMAQWFTKHGVPSAAISAGTTPQQRADGIRELKDGKLCCIFTVDVFNEGIDIPEVDVVLMLRPTQSATVYVQQLGRGLRRYPAKSVLTVLDFVGHHRSEFDLAGKYLLMTGKTRTELVRDLEKGYPSLPGASRIVLDEIAYSEVLASVRRAVGNSKIGALVEDLRSVGIDKRLAAFLELSNRKLDDVYRADRSWNTIVLKAKGSPKATKEEHALSKRLHRLRTVDDPDRMEGYSRVATQILDGVPVLEGDPWARMLVDFMFPKDKFESFQSAVELLSQYPAVLEEVVELMEAARTNIELMPLPLSDNLGDLPLRSHARYQREELLSGLKWTSMDRRPGSHREGVLWSPEVNTDLFLINLHKDEKKFTQSTMYRDIPVTKDLFDWESQSTTSQKTATGSRYINHRANGTSILLAVRNAPADEIGTAPFTLLGTAQVESYAGDRPIRFRWRLDRSMPADVLAQASVIGA